MTNAERLDRIRQENMDHFGFGPRAMRRCKVCAHCHTMSPASELFCRECGKRLPRDTLYQLYKSRHKSCPACDTVVSTATRYCPQCGTPLAEGGENGRARPDNSPKGETAAQSAAWEEERI